MIDITGKAKINSIIIKGTPAMRSSAISKLLLLENTEYSKHNFDEIFDIMKNSNQIEMESFDLTIWWVKDKKGNDLEQ